MIAPVVHPCTMLLLFLVTLLPTCHSFRFRSLFRHHQKIQPCAAAAFSNHATATQSQSHVSRLYAADGSKEAEEWLSCKVLSNVADGTGLRLIGVEVGDASVAAAYTTPGQYLKLKTDAGPDTKASFLAIASPPQQLGAFSFLVKETGSNAALTGAAPGSSVLVTRPMGNGFKIFDAFEGYRNDFPVNNVLLLAAGSGLAPIAAAIDSGLLGLGSTSVTSLFPRSGTLYIGAKVVPVLSQTADPACKDWKGATGYVQDQLRKDGVGPAKNAAALLCGMRPMTDAVKETLLESGVYEGRVMFNF